MANTLTALAPLFLWCVAPVQASIYNARCTVSEDCLKIYNRDYECSEGSCIRHHFDYSTRELFGAVTVVFVSMITNAGGVGAGTVIIPVFEIFYNFVSSDAIPLSRITIFAGSLVNYLLNWNQRDERTGRHLIDYRLSAVMMPLLLAGTQVGVILSRFLPSVVITGTLVLYLSHSARQMLKRAKSDSAKETQSLEVSETMTESDSVKDQSAADINQNQAYELAVDKSSSEIRDSSSVVTAADGFSLENKTQASDPKIEFEKTIDSYESSTYLGSLAKKINHTLKEVDELVKTHKNSLISCGVSFFLIMCSAAIRGGEGRDSIIGLRTCSSATTLVFVITQLTALIFAIGNYFANRSHFDAEDKDCTSQEEIYERRELRKKLLYACYVTGILAGLLGVGGGMILNLYMLSLGMDPYLSTALSTFIVLFSSGATTFQFIIAGAIHIRHAYLFMTLSLIGSLVGNLVLKAAIKRFKRPSILIWVLFGVLCLAVTVLPVEMIYSVVRSHTNALAFGHLC